MEEGDRKAHPLLWGGERVDPWRLAEPAQRRAGGLDVGHFVVVFVICMAISLQKYVGHAKVEFMPYSV